VALRSFSTSGARVPRGLHLACGGGENRHLTSECGPSTALPADRRAAAARVTTQARNTPDALATSGSVREDHAFVPRDEGRVADGGGWLAGAP